MTVDIVNGRRHADGMTHFMKNNTSNRYRRRPSRVRCFLSWTTTRRRIGWLAGLSARLRLFSLHLHANLPPAARLPPTRTIVTDHGPPGRSANRSAAATALFVVISIFQTFVDRCWFPIIIVVSSPTDATVTADTHLGGRLWGGVRVSTRFQFSQNRSSRFSLSRVWSACSIGNSELPVYSQWLYYDQSWEK